MPAQMISCLPKGICSWDFWLDMEGGKVSLVFNLMGEQGALTIEGETYLVRKHGMGSGHWSLELDGQEVASAQKVSMLSRKIEMSTPMGELVLSPESALGRCFKLFCEEQLLAKIEPMHPFTRRSTIQLDAADYDSPTLAFAFWLVLMSWRRAQQRSSS